MVEKRIASQSRVFVRTSNAVYEGTITLPMRTRLKEFLGRPQPTVVLTDVVITESAGVSADGSGHVEEANVFKTHVQFITTVDEEKSTGKEIHGRDAVAAKMGREFYSFRLSAGFTVEGEILGGEKTILYHKGSFLAVIDPSIVDRNGRKLDGDFSFVLINLARLESFTRLSRQSDALTEQAELAEAEHERDPGEEPEQEMDFSDFEEQFIRLDRPVQVPSPRE